MRNEFITYMELQGHSVATIATYSYVVDRFLKWCDKHDHKADQINYLNCTKFIGQLQNTKIRNGKNYEAVTIKGFLSALNLFFGFLVTDGYRNVSPLEGHVFKVDRNYIHQLLSRVELQRLYNSFPTMMLNKHQCPSVAVRDKVLTGLLVFQGLKSSTLKQLTVDDINLEKQKIKVPGTSTSNPRTLDLHRNQIRDLKSYLDHHRPKLQEKLNRYTDRLFELNSDRFACIMSPLSDKLKRLDYNFKNSRQIRASVITHWLQEHDLRKVQVMAGHKHISSTEAYQTKDPDINREAADTYHPLR